MSVDSLIRVSRRVDLYLFIRHRWWNMPHRKKAREARHTCVGFNLQTYSQGGCPPCHISPSAGTISAFHPKRNARSEQKHLNPCQLIRGIHCNLGKYWLLSLAFLTLVTEVPQIRRYKALILQRFQARLTLFSKYFAPFPHGTCLLSDSRRC